MEPECEDGNIEYKLKLINKSQKRIEELASQMRYRCEEGCGECIYNIGVEDDGTLTGIKPQEYEETICHLTKAADKNNYSIKLLTCTSVESDSTKNVYEILIREINENNYIDLKVAVAGSVDVGKSSMLGVLTSGRNDDGRGQARISVFNYPHEVRSGRTSSIGHHIIGFDGEGTVVNYHSGVGSSLSWPEIVRRSTKIVSLFDLAGHEKYLKTTIAGLTCMTPDLCIIVVGANRGVIRMTREHIFLCVVLKIPFIIVITKIDLVSTKANILAETFDSISKILKSVGVRRIPLKIETQEDIIRSAIHIHSESIAPIFSISNVTGQGIQDLKNFLNLTRKRPGNSSGINDVEYHIDTTWTISGVGTVVGGYLFSGTVKIGDKLLLGPNTSKYIQVTIKSIHCKKISLQTVNPGSYVCFGLRGISRSCVRKGNVLLSSPVQQVACREFIADIKVMRSHSTTVKVNYEPVMHVLAIRKSVKLIRIIHKQNARDPDSTVDDDVLRTGDSAKIVLSFCYDTEFIKPGSRILLVEGVTKIVGIITEIIS